MNIFNTKLTPADKERLEDEKNLGRRAKLAWDSYMGKVIEHRRDSIFSTFRKSRPDDVDQLITLRNLLAAVDDIETAIKLDIERGEYAAKQLNEDKSDD